MSVFGAPRFRAPKFSLVEILILCGALAAAGFVGVIAGL